MRRTNSEWQRLKGLCLLSLMLLNVSAAFSNAPDWQIVPENYEQSMMMTGIVYFEDEEIKDTSVQLAAFLGNECRGVDSTVYYPALNKYIVSLIVYGHNADENKTISFRYYNKESDTTIILPDTIAFLSDAIIGNFASPYCWGDVPVNIKTVTHATSYDLITPDAGRFILSLKQPLSESVTLSLISANGSVFYRETYPKGTSRIHVENIPTGFYILTLNGRLQRETGKLLVY